MQPSPFALTLIEDVAPILRSIKRVLALPEPFDPASSDRVFRVACPITGQLLTEVLNRVHRVAPGVRLEWLSAPRQVYAATAEGLLDIAHLGGETRLPDGLDEIEAPSFEWTSFVRAGHPALADWGPEAWSTYGHVQVNIANDAPSPLEKTADAAPPERHVAALISEFSSLGPLLAGTDLIGTFPRILMAWDMETYGLQPLIPPITLPPFRTRLFWSSQMANDSASKWIREIVLTAYSECHQKATARVERAITATKGR